MPRYATPRHPVPEWATSAMELFGMNPLRAEIIRLLASHPDGVKLGVITDELGVVTMTAYRHLQELLRLGAATVDSGDDGEHGKGRHNTYKLDPAAVEQAITEYQRYITGQ